MLVLARKKDESIIIGEDIVVKIVGIEKGVVKLGIEAPSDVTIIRSELAEDVAKMNKASSEHAEIEEIKHLSELMHK